MFRPTATSGWRARCAATFDPNPTPETTMIAATNRAPRERPSASTTLVPVNVLSPR